MGKQTAQAKEVYWMLDVAVSGIVCTEYRSIILDNCKHRYSQCLGKIVVSATSNHYHWSSSIID